MKWRNCLVIVLVCLLNQVFGQYDENGYKKYFIQNIADLDPVEGIWTTSVTLTLYYSGVQQEESLDKQQEYNIAIKKGNNQFNIYDWENFLDRGAGKVGYKMKINFTNSATEGLFLCEILFYDGINKLSDLHQTVKTTAILKSEGVFEISYKLPKSIVNQALKGYVLRKNLLGDNYVNPDKFEIVEKDQFIKIFPTLDEIKKKRPKQGSGFAISSDGYIITNNHVIENANKIRVRGINGDFSKIYSAKVEVIDKNNDLAILKINDNSFNGLGNVPYLIKSSSSSVGENIFVLGYPFTEAMGSEIKLTTGILSSKTGFQGDITTYQISAPVQPGNSGCPLFDIQGNVIGIINSKFTPAENASYAIKTSYLLNLIDLLEKKPSLPTNSLLKDFPLTKQVEEVKSFIYIVEVN